MAEDVQDKVLSTTSNTEVYDEDANKIVVPAGFKITNDTNKVTEGIVIEDAIEGSPTKGSQFVWIPVGKVNKEDGTSVDIELNRYTFDSSGNKTAWGNSKISGKYSEDKTKTKDNYVAEGIGTFRLSAILNGGYYIGRYEAHKLVKPDGSNQVVTHTNNVPTFTSLCQIEAAILSRMMYDNVETNITSDLANSYAWDTAIAFIQEFSDNKTYSHANYTSNSDSDVFCNIYNMASGCVEWNTETSYGDYGDAIFRGSGGVYTGFDASYRVGVSALEGQSSNPGSVGTSYSFRPIIYLRQEGKLMVTDVQGKVLSTTQNTEVFDELGNKIIVPKGFKIKEGICVTDGIVIEDMTQGTLTQGSQFVWIPVGKVNKEDETSVNIELNRYTFDSNGNATAHNDSSISDKYSEDTTKNKDNWIAEDIEAFKTSAINNGGFYLGKYEAHQLVKSDGSNQVVCYTYNNVPVFTKLCQIEAAILSRMMYDDNTQTDITSDLVNSYAWDTALVFIQECSDNKKYSQVKAKDISNPDKDVVCNIYNMASGCVEWNTETSYGDYGNAIFRGGGGVYTDFYASYRTGVSALEGQSSNPGAVGTSYSFRPIIYF